MTDLRKAAEMVLDELEHFNKTSKEAYLYDFTNEIAALRQALAQPEQEPVAWLEYDNEGYLFLSGKRKGAFPVFIAPPSKPWVSLTDDERQNIKGRWICGEFESFDDCLVVFEAALRSKNEHHTKQNTQA